MEPIQIRVVNLSWQATQDEIVAWVKGFAKVSECKLVLDYKKRSKGLAYITLEDEGSLQAALSHNEEEFLGRKVRITKAKPLSEKVPKEKIPKEKKQNQRKNSNEPVKPKEAKVPKEPKAQKDPKEPKKPKVPKEPKEPKNPKDPKEPKVSKEIKSKKGEKVDAKKKNFKPRANKQPYIKMNDQNSVFVSNLAWKTSELALGRHFEAYGDIEMVKILENEFGKSRGFGFVEFENQSFVEKALTANGSQLENRAIRVSVINRERKPRKNSKKISE